MIVQEDGWVTMSTTHWTRTLSLDLTLHILTTTLSTASPDMVRLCLLLLHVALHAARIMCVSPLCAQAMYKYSKTPIYHAPIYRKPRFTAP